MPELFRVCGESGYIGHHQDITDLKQSEEAVRYSRARFRDYAEASAYWFWEMDADLRFTYMSPNVERVVGVKPEWHYGKTRQDILGTGYDRETWDAHLKTLRRHEPFRDFVFYRVGEGVEPRWLSTSGTPVFDQDGDFQGYRGSGSDVTGAVAAERAIQESEAQMRLVTDNLPVLIVQFDAELRFQFANEACQKWYARPLDRIIGATVGEVLGAEAMAVLRPRLDAARQGETTSFEERVTYPDGVTRDVQITYIPNRGSNGDVAGGFGLVMDITGQKRAEVARDRFLDAIENLSEGLALYDGEERLVICNREYRRVLGLAGDVAKPGMRLEEILRAMIERGVIPEAEADPEAWLEARMVRHRRASGDPEVFEAERVDRRYLVCEERLRDGSVIISTLDITERKEAEEALREREAMLNAVVENVPISLCLKDREGRFTLVNPGFERLHGVTAAEVLGKTFFDILPHEIAADAAAEDRHVVQSGEPLRTDYSWPAHLGVQHELIFKFPLRLHHEGPITGVGVIALDITEQRRQEEQLD